MQLPSREAFSTPYWLRSQPLEIGSHTWSPGVKLEFPVLKELDTDLHTFIRIFILKHPDIEQANLFVTQLMFAWCGNRTHEFQTLDLRALARAPPRTW